MQSILDSVLGHHTTTLTRAWAEAWADVEVDLIDSLTILAAGGDLSPERIARDQRMIQGLATSREALDTLAALSGTTISDDVERVLGLGHDGELAMIAAQLPDAGPSPVRASATQLEAILTRSTEQITALTAPISPETDSAIRSQLLRGMVSGDNPRTTAQLMVTAAGGAFTGGLTRALTISRTEMLDAMRAAQKTADLTNPGLVTGWVWSAELSVRTCRSCIAMHGTVHPPDEDGPLDHQSGRCARVPQTASWAALGFPGIPEPDLGLTDAGEWFADLTDEDQKSILGARGLDAWQRGDYPMSDWAQRRTSDGWRDSFTPSKPPKGAT